MIRIFFLLGVLAGCAQPGSVGSRAAAGTPWCIIQCHVSVATVEEPTTAPVTQSINSTTTGGTRTRTTTETD
jgi:hypothetical protein